MPPSQTTTCPSAWIEIVICEPRGSVWMSTGNMSSGSAVVPFIGKRVSTLAVTPAFAASSRSFCSAQETSASTTPRAAGPCRRPISTANASSSQAWGVSSADEGEVEDERHVVRPAGLDGRGIDRERRHLRGERRRHVEVVELRALPGADVAARPALAAGAVGGRRGRLGDDGLDLHEAERLHRGEERVGPGEVPLVLRGLGDVEVAAEDDPGPVGRVEQRQQVRDDPVDRHQRRAIQHAIDADEGDRLESGDRHASDRDRPRVRLVEQVATLAPGHAHRADRLDHDGRIEGHDRRAPVAVPGDLAVHGPVPRHVQRRHGLLDERDLRADPLGEVRPGAAPRVRRQQRLAPVVQVPGRDPEGRPRRIVIGHNRIVAEGCDSSLSLGSGVDPARVGPLSWMTRWRSSTNRPEAGSTDAASPSAPTVARWSVRAA